MNRFWIHKRVERLWETRGALACLLFPLAAVFSWGAALRRQCYRSGLLRVRPLSAPVVVIGNLTVGGTGKTPMVIWLARRFRRWGRRPGIVSRGYGGKREADLLPVAPDSDPRQAGDEPVLLAMRARCPVMVAKDRWQAADALCRQHGCDVILADDGLQHFALPGDFRICMVDGQRRFGNGWCLPAGPLREPLSRLREMDIIVCNGGEARSEAREGCRMELRPDESLRNLRDPSRRLKLADLSGREAHALAGVGNPEPFFSLLESQGVRIRRHPFPDHCRYRPEDLEFADDLPVIMTEKDAVKCRSFCTERHWCLPVDAVLPESFEKRMRAWLMSAAPGAQDTEAMAQ